MASTSQISERAPAKWPSARGFRPHKARRLSWLTLFVYAVVALAAPLVVCFGPDVLPPTAPLVANAALEGRFTLHPDFTGGSDLHRGPARPAGTRG